MAFRSSALIVSPKRAEDPRSRGKKIDRDSVGNQISLELHPRKESKSVSLRVSAGQQWACKILRAHAQVQGVIGVGISSS